MEAKPISAAVLASALNALHHPVLVTDKEMNAVFCNPAMLAYIGKVTGRRWDLEQVMGLNMEQLHPPRAFKGMRERFERTLSGERLPPRFNTAGDTMFMTYDSPVVDETGDTVGVVMEKIPVNIVNDAADNS